MPFPSFTFPAFLLAVLLPYHFAPSTRIREAVLLTANAIFVASFFGSFAVAIPLLLFAGIGYLFIRLSHTFKSTLATASFLVAIVAIFVYLKGYSFLGGFLPKVPGYETIGLSYILFRIIHLIVDIRGGAVQGKISPLSYLGFIFFFLNFVSGPIQSYQKFREQIEEADPAALTATEITAAFSRMTTGYFKILLASPCFHSFLEKFPAAYASAHCRHSLFLVSGWYALGAVSYALHLYFNFSGYMDIVIGAGQLFGLFLPENFNRPFLAENFLDFWSRWHTTLSQWFKIYLFNPLLKALMLRFQAPGLRSYLAVISFLLVFFVMGVWHGTTAMLVVYGIFLGCGVSLNKLYQVKMQKWLGKKGYADLCARPTYRYFCRGAALSYFFIALSCLWTDTSELHKLFGPKLLPMLATVFCVMALATSLAAYLYDALVMAVRSVHISKIRPYWRARLSIPLLAGKVYLIFYLIFRFSNQAPEFIYRNF